MSTNANMSGGGRGGGPCGACKFLRRKCTPTCVFAPYFDSEQGASHFAAVHKVFGASNVSKLLNHIPATKRLDAVVTICYEAQSRLRDPIYGCVAHIFALQHQVANLQSELSYLHAYLATMEISPPPVPPQSAAPSIQVVGPSVIDLPEIPAANDHLSALCDSMVYPSWTIHQRQQMEPRLPLVTTAQPDIPPLTAGGEDLQELARELLSRHVTPVGTGTGTCRNLQALDLPPPRRSH